MDKLERRPRWQVVTGHAVLAVVSALSVFPIAWMYLTSLRPASDVYDQSPLPAALTFGNYAYVWQTIPIGRMLVNTFVMAALVSLGQLLVSLFAAYAFTRWRFPGHRLVFLMFACTFLVPIQVSMIPNYVTLSQFGWLDTLAAVIVPQVTGGFAVLMLYQHMRAFPKDLLDAARMDGRSSWGTLWTVVVPNLRPALAALAILMFVNAWNEYFWPALVLRRADSVVQVGIRAFLGAEGDDWGALMAAAGLTCLPIFVVYVLLQRQVLDAFVRSGLR
ncbi:carbohydrate ABC transporter permease [Spongiactinospora sp. 9N601]|uniref:carbohydrate ABC transporter permease n=1 Tax=Spongiactinospora sp. 9N601 TaxID=3375149 RepID=UPI003790F56E